MAVGRITAVWLLLGHAATTLRTLSSLTRTTFGPHALTIVTEARTAELALQSYLLDALGVPTGPDELAAASASVAPTPTSGRDPVMLLTTRVAATAHAATSMLPRSVSRPTVDPQHVDYTHLAACTTLQTHLAIDLLDLTVATVSEHLDRMCIDPWWADLADVVANALADIRCEIR